MSAYIIRRLWQMIPTMLGVILLVFILTSIGGTIGTFVGSANIVSKLFG